MSLSLPLLFLTVTRVLEEEITDSEGSKIQTTRGFLVSPTSVRVDLLFSTHFESSYNHCPQTNDSSVVGVVRMENFVLVVGAGIKLTNSSGRLHKWMEARFHGNLTAVEVKGDGIGVAEFRSGVLPELLKSVGTLVFSGGPLQLLPAYLIWMPFSSSATVSPEA